MKIPKRVRQNEGYMSFWTKEEVIGNSQVDKKEQTFGKQVLAGLPRNRDGGASGGAEFGLDFPCQSHLIDFAEILFRKQDFLFESL